MRQTSSKATWQTVHSMFGPFAIGNIFMLAALLMFALFQPNGAPIPLWAGLAVALLMLIGIGFIVKGTFRFKNVRTSAKEDQRRIAAGLPLDRNEPKE